MTSHFVFWLLLLAGLVLACLYVVRRLRTNGIKLPFVGKIVRLPSGEVVIAVIDPVNSESTSK